MTINEARAAIMLRLIGSGFTPEQYTDLGSGGPTFNIPDVSVPVWGRLSVRFNLHPQQTLGGVGVPVKFRRIGIATVQVFTPITSGEYTNDEACQVVESAFIKQTGDTPLQYGGVPAGGDIRIESVGRDGVWFQQNVIIPFSFETCVV